MVKAKLFNNSMYSEDKPDKSNIVKGPFKQQRTIFNYRL